MTDSLKRARAVGVPIVAITTQDQPNTVAQIAGALNGSMPLLCWDVVRGYSPLNEPGIDAKAKILEKHDEMGLTNFAEALIAALELPERSILICFNAHRFLDDPAPCQALMNLRNLFKNSQRTIVLLAPGFSLPAELAQDVLLLDEPLPSEDEIRVSFGKLATENELAMEDDTLERATDALRGLAAFAGEQASALSIQADRSVSLPELWARKKAMLPKGLELEYPSQTFDDIGGAVAVKAFFNQLGAGPRKFRVVIIIDEIEKLVAGAGGDSGLGDSSGTSQDAMAVLLTELEDRDYFGITHFGPPGTGKTYTARAIAATFGLPCVRMDTGAMKGRYVGDSEGAIRAALKAIYALAGDGGALIVATTNQFGSLPTALRDRLAKLGVWFYDLPTAAERSAIAKLQAKHYGLKAKDAAAFFEPLEGWSGRNIRNCCELAQALACDFAEASKYVIPQAQQEPAGLERLRKMAEGRFLSASTPGVYKAARVKESLTPESGRKVNL